MRYFIVTYKKKADGQYDEIVSVENKVKSKVVSMANVILDFKDKKVIKLRLEAGMQVDKDWDKIHAYYFEHYKDIVEKLDTKYEALEALKEING